jgi:hypothetical protein
LLAVGVGQRPFAARPARIHVQTPRHQRVERPRIGYHLTARQQQPARAVVHRKRNRRADPDVDARKRLEVAFH